MYKVKIAETESEEESAYELFYKSFGPTYYDAKEVFDLTRKYDPTLKNENLFIIKEKDSVIAAVRTVTRSLKLFDKRFDICGIATTVVHPEHRGKGLFNIITQSVLNEMVNRRLSLCLIFARRAIDNIYVNHGFWGTPVERRFTVLDAPELDVNLSFRRIQIEDISFMEKTYRQVYGSMSVFIDRPKPLWHAKMKNPNFHKQFDGYVCTQNETEIGYVISEHGKGIIEVCSCSDDQDTYKSIFFSRNSPVREAALSSISLSMEHPAMKAFRGHAYSIFTRHPHYGGNILKIFNPCDKKSKIMKLVESRLANRDIKIPDGLENFPPHVVSRVIISALFGYEVPETRNVLEIGEKWNTLKPVDFLFSSLDDF